MKPAFELQLNKSVVEGMVTMGRFDGRTQSVSSCFHSRECLPALRALCNSTHQSLVLSLRQLFPPQHPITQHHTVRYRVLTRALLIIT
jgi:hypothetical protein